MRPISQINEIDHLKQNKKKKKVMFQDEERIQIFSDIETQEVRTTYVLTYKTIR